MERCQEDREGQLFPGYQGACFPPLCYPCVTGRSFNPHTWQVMWVSSPLSIAFAQRFLSPEVCRRAHP
jgi:hypothetical protein